MMYDFLSASLCVLTRFANNYNHEPRNTTQLIIIGSWHLAVALGRSSERERERTLCEAEAG